MEIAGYNMPEELYYDQYHFWTRVDGDELVIGMDDFAEKLAGQIVFVQLPFVGKAVTAGKKFAKVESGKWLAANSYKYGFILRYLKGKEAICYPGFEAKLTGATISEKSVVEDGNVITGKGPGVAVDFALKIVASLKGEAVAMKIKEDLMIG